MIAATVGLILGQIFAGEISHWIFSTTDRTDLVRAAFVGLWAQMDYRAADLALPRGAAVDLVRGRERRKRPHHDRLDDPPCGRLPRGALGVLVGNFLGTLAVYLGLLAYRRGKQLGSSSSWELFIKMEHFGKSPSCRPRLRSGGSTSSTASS